MVAVQQYLDIVRDGPTIDGSISDVRHLADLGATNGGFQIYPVESSSTEPHTMYAIYKYIVCSTVLRKARLD